MTNKYAITKFDDVQRHPWDCECGLCERVGSRSYGVGIFVIDSNDSDAVKGAILSHNPSERVYGITIDVARESAKSRVAALGYTFIGDF